MKKNQEKYYVEQAAEHLNVSWKIVKDRESPDFLISEEDHIFGLEVSELFCGLEEEKGSDDKAHESNNQTMIDWFQKKFEVEKSDFLTVAIWGSINETTMGKLHDDLLQIDFGSMNFGDKIVLEQPKELERSERLKAYVTKAFRHDWYRLNDRIGFVNQNALHFIDNRVAEKAIKLDKYKINVGPDVRLLLIANWNNNSGKMRISEQSEKPTFNPRGFKSVYFLSYPFYAVEIKPESVIEQ